MQEREIDGHLRGMWPDRQHEDFQWMAGPVQDSLPGFHVRRIAPLRPRESWVYVSIGAYKVGAPRREFLILSPVESVRHVESLAMVSHFHSLPGHRVELGSTMNLGRPWLEGSEADRFLASPPYSLEREFWRTGSPDDGVEFTWLVPIYAEESEYAKRRGLEALEERLEKNGVNLVDPRRTSVVGRW
ncbi:suppressor of fused domain protein [Streptomyces sp. NPDC007896]|uniref:suppressor of fused domain protein n=1 Tax=Streptomyces sp. NPDC007896 TaxID=3364784 RepID=UPI0036E33E8B